MIVIEGNRKTQRNDKYMYRIEYELYDNYLYYLFNRDGVIRGIKV